MENDATEMGERKETTKCKQRQRNNQRKKCRQIKDRYEKPEE